MSWISRSFDYGAAWLVTIAGMLALESYYFGLSTKACGSFGWGVYGAMISLLFIVYGPVVVLIPLTLFVGGGFFYRLREPRWRPVAILAAVIVAVGVLGFMLTRASKEACSAL